MAAQDFDATATPTDIVSALSLGAGAYSIGNASTTATLFVRSQATAPQPDARAFRIEPGAVGTIRGDEPTFVWTDDLSGCPIVVDETP